MEAVAKHDFSATAEDELSFRKGQILKVRLFLRLCGSDSCACRRVCVNIEQSEFLEEI